MKSSVNLYVNSIDSIDHQPGKWKVQLVDADREKCSLVDVEGTFHDQDGTFHDQM